MAVKISFRLKEPQKGVSKSKQRESLVFMFVNFGYYKFTPEGNKKYIPLKYSTGEFILPEYWNKDVQEARQVKDFDFDTFNTRLENLSNCAKTEIRNLLNEDISPTPDILRQRIDQSLDKVSLPDKKTLNEYVSSFITDMESGARLSDHNNHKGKYSPGTIKNYKGFQSQFDEFQLQKNSTLDFQDITIDFYNDFVGFFYQKNYSPNTVGRHIKILKTLMRHAREENLHDNTEIDRKAFKAMKVEVSNIYLSDDELNRLFKLDLNEQPELDLVRDVFLVGCYTAQRYSDYSRIRKENIRTLSNGKKVIELIQQKTSETVIIPIKPELEILLKKYNYTLPRTHEQKVNSRIKKVARKAKIIQVIPTESERGCIIIKKDVPKCDLIKTHTARRSGCTNMYLAGIPSIDIMKISGHKTEREFLNYIKVGKEETAENLTNHSYFSNQNLKVI